MEPDSRRICYLTEMVSIYTKYMVNELGRVDEQVMVNFLSDMILNQHSGEKAFRAYRKDNDLLRSEIKDSIRMLEDGGLIARHPEAKDHIISPYSIGTDDIAVYVGPNKTSDAQKFGEINL